METENWLSNEQKFWGFQTFLKIQKNFKLFSFFVNFNKFEPLNKSNTIICDDLATIQRLSRKVHGYLHINSFDFQKRERVACDSFVLIFHRLII